jgi:hypothetical protein
LTYLYPAGAQRGQTVEVTAGGTFERWPVAAWADDSSVTIKPGKDKGKLTVTVAADAVPGPRWVRLHDAEGASGLRPFLIGTLPEILEQEPNDDPKKPQALTSSTVVVNGRLAQAGDVDGFALQLKKGQTLVAAVEANRALGSPMDAILQVVSAAGAVLDQNNDCLGLDPRLAFTVPMDGTYLVRLFAFPAVPDSSIRFAGGEAFVYRLTLTTGGCVDYAFPLAVSRENPAAVELIGWNIPAAARQRPVSAAEGAEVFRAFDPRWAGYFDVRLEPHPTALETRPADLAKPQRLEIPSTVSGRLEADGEVDRYPFDARKGQRLSFRVEARALGFALDPVLQVADAAGKVLAQMDDPAGRTGSRDPELLFPVPQDGQYVLQIRDLHGAGGPRFVYRLRATLAQPDFSLTLTADRFIVIPGKPVDIQVTIERANGFGEPVEVVPLGLPQGITAAPVSPPSASAKAIAFRLTAVPGASSGPFQLLGRVPAKPGGTRLARFSMPDLNTASPHLWLTVAPAPPKTAP